VSAARRACLVLGLCAGCGVDTAVDAGACRSPTRVDATASAGDVEPILARSCTLGGCHLGAPGAGGLVLDVSSVGWVSAVVGVRAQEAPTMQLVAAGQPEQSWLVAKIFGSFCGVTCERTLGCGAPMPSGEPLSDADRAIIMAWIGDGAR
jgi:hypothetical protein